MQDPVLEDRVRRLAVSTSLSAAEIHRRLLVGSDGQPPARISYPPIQRAVAQIRLEARGASMDLSPGSLAERIVYLLDRELTRLEVARGGADLERLDRIARTLRTVEPIRPRGQATVHTLRSLVPESERP